MWFQLGHVPDRNLTSHFACLGPSFLICKIKVLNYMTSRSLPAPMCKDTMITTILPSGLHYHLDLKEVACLLQCHKGLLGKSKMKSLYSAQVTSLPLNSPPTLKVENMAQGKIYLHSHIYVDQLLDLS